MRRIGIIALLLFVVGASAASAQYGGSRSAYGPTHKLEICGYGGYSWTWSRSVYHPDKGSGSADIKNSSIWGVELDVNAMPGKQLSLLYHRQDSKLTFKQGNFVEDIADMAVEYWHVGGVGGVQKGNVLPFGSFSLGGTRYISSYPGSGDIWKFSVLMGLGAKVYVHERIGLRFQGRVPMTFTSGGFGFGCGGYGCGATVGGTGIAQFDLSAGIMILL